MRCLVWAASAWALVILLNSCGYIGPVRPPSPNIPVAVTDLKVTQVGSQLSWSFTLPAQTTDQIDIDSFHLIELRAGPDVKPFDFRKWLAASSAISIPPSQTDDEVNNRRMTSKTAASQWEGTAIAVAIRTAERKQRFSSWSNVVHLRVVKPLAPPVIEAASDAKGVKVTIEAAPDHAKVRILRQGPNNAAPVEAGVVEGKTLVDTAADYGTHYLYTAVSFDDSDAANAISESSAPVPITPVDTFPPQVPTNVTALPGPSSIEVSWERSPDFDLKGYRVLRSVNGSGFEQLGSMTSLPTYSDSDVKRGSVYRYRISAVDERGNVSAPTAPVEVSY